MIDHKANVGDVSQKLYSVLMSKEVSDFNKLEYLKKIVDMIDERKLDILALALQINAEKGVTDNGKK